MSVNSMQAQALTQRVATFTPPLLAQNQLQAQLNLRFLCGFNCEERKEQSVSDSVMLLASLQMLPTVSVLRDKDSTAIPEVDTVIIGKVPFFLPSFLSFQGRGFPEASCGFLVSFFPNVSRSQR